MIIADHLREEGHRVMVANDGMQGLAHVRQNEIELAIVDLVMPDLDGIEFIRRVKDVKPGISVILMSGFVELLEEKKKLAMQLGATKILHKPFSFPDIEELVNSFAQPPQRSTTKSSAKKSCHTH